MSPALFRRISIHFQHARATAPKGSLTYVRATRALLALGYGAGLHKLSEMLKRTPTP